MPKTSTKSSAKKSSSSKRTSTKTKSNIDKKKEVKISKKHAETLKDSIDNLTYVMKNIYDIFSKASDEMYEEHDLHFERVAPIASKLDELIKQNEFILTTIKSLFEELKNLKQKEIELERTVENALLLNDLKELKEVEEDKIGTHNHQLSSEPLHDKDNSSKEELENQILNSIGDSGVKDKGNSEVFKNKLPE